jgi:hypothetical protein
MPSSRRRVPGHWCRLEFCISCLEFVTDSEARCSPFCAGIRQLCRPNGARKAQWPLRVAAGWGGKSGCRAGCGARAWRPCAPQLACHRIYLWCGSRWLRWRVEAFTEPAGPCPLPPSLTVIMGSWPPAGFRGAENRPCADCCCYNADSIDCKQQESAQGGIGGQLRWNWGPIQAGLASSAGTSGLAGPAGTGRPGGGWRDWRDWSALAGGSLGEQDPV